jgi:hypothetical protein
LTWCFVNDTAADIVITLGSKFLNGNIVPPIESPLELVDSNLTFTIAKGTKSYLVVIRDAERDTFDIVEYVYQQVTSNILDGIWGYWKLDSGGADSSGNGKNLSQDDLFPNVVTPSGTEGGVQSSSAIQAFRWYLVELLTASPLTYNILYDTGEITSSMEDDIDPDLFVATDEVVDGYIWPGTPYKRRLDVKINDEWTEWISGVSPDFLYLDVPGGTPYPYKSEGIYEWQQLLSAHLIILAEEYNGNANAHIGDTIVFTGTNRYKPPNPYPSYEAGKVGNAVLFDSAIGNEWLHRHDAWDASVNGGKFTVAFWFNGSGRGCAFYLGDIWIDLNRSATPGSSYTLSVSTDNQYVSPSITSGEWHFICIYYDGTGLFVEVDNVLVASDTSSADPNTSNDAETGMGQPYSGQFLFDEAAIWQRDLTADERAYLWNGGAGRTLY